MSLDFCPKCGYQFNSSEVIVDLDYNVVIRGGNKIKLSKREAEILHVLWSEHPRLVSHERIIMRVYGMGDEPSCAYGMLSQYVYRLRKKLKVLNIEIGNVHGEGYLLKLNGECQ